MKRYPVISTKVTRVRIDDERTGPPSSPIQKYAIVDIHRPTTTTTTAADGGGGGCGGVDGGRGVERRRGRGR